jgi:hypothetical protein
MVESVLIPLKLYDRALECLSRVAKLLNPDGFSLYTLSNHYLNPYVSMTGAITYLKMNDPQGVILMMEALDIAVKKANNIPAEYRILSNIMKFHPDPKTWMVESRLNLQSQMNIKEKVKSIIFY